MRDFHYDVDSVAAAKRLQLSMVELLERVTRDINRRAEAGIRRLLEFGVPLEKIGVDVVMEPPCDPYKPIMRYTVVVRERE